ncbi:hypothetical protein [Leptolyngbya sp. FACHB-541]|uniref:hypothetical protein n=1 Tax=Leptolyngbya sp. FACHB-541 TaxID=2692810 RepID=UPI001F55A76A|nr:hypothetical protein [Leptolyngbya sp. FACHB-541]
MNNIQMEGVDSTLSQVVLEDIQYLKQHLDDILVSSDQTLIKNLIEETEFFLQQTKSNSKTYQEKYDAFDQLTNSWFGVWNHYKHIPEAINLIKLLNHLTNHSIAYSCLFLSLSRINEGRTGEYEADLERIVSGFLLLSQIVDVFTNFFSISDLKQIQNGAKNAISISIRDVEEYFENGLELSILVTQLRAYSSLIVLRVEEYINTSEELEQNSKVIVEVASNYHSDKLDAEARPAVSNNKQLRPFGLCAGEFIVPDDFDSPLPEEILSAFEGK